MTPSPELASYMAHLCARWLCVEIRFENDAAARSEAAARSPETGTSVCQGWADPCYCKISLRFSSNSALSISPLANRSFKISRAREAVSCTSGSSSRRALRQPQKHMAKSSIRFREIRASSPFGSPRRANLAVDHVRHRHRDGLWRLIDSLHDLLDRIARHRVDLQ